MKNGPPAFGPVSGHRNSSLGPLSINVLCLLLKTNSVIDKPMKRRIRIPEQIQTQVMCVSHNTCCVCAEMGVGKHVQIHHIDGDRNNNAFENLAVLCLECHNKTQLKGGFAKQLTPKLVTEYNNNWRDRVRARRNRYDEMIANLNPKNGLSSSSLPEHKKPKSPHLVFIDSLPELKETLLDQVSEKMDSGWFSTMAGGCYDYIESSIAILVALSGYYSTSPFGNQSPQKYFSEIVSSRCQWHRAIAEPEGPGTCGQMASFIVASSVQADVEKMVEDMVYAIVLGKRDIGDSFDFPSWLKRWRSH